MTPPGVQVLEPGARFGKYTIVRRLGAGGMAAVYEAVHVTLKKRVAIKVLFPELARSEKVTERFLREGEASARIHHPHVVDVTDVGIEGGLPYLVMELLEGVDLARLITERGKLSVPDLVDVLVPVCAALTEAHRQRVVHRDLKPANVFIVEDPVYGRVPKLLDFGISKVEQDDQVGLTTTGALVGTPAYMSPEQARGDAVDARTDQYSLGVIAYEALTATRAFRGQSVYEVLNRIVTGTFDAPRTHAPDLPPAFEAIVLRMMAREPAERFADMTELALVLLPLASARTRTVWEPLLRRQWTPGAADQPRTTLDVVPPTVALSPSPAPRKPPSPLPIFAPPPAPRRPLATIVGVAVAVAGGVVLVTSMRAPAASPPPSGVAAIAAGVPAMPASAATSASPRAPAAVPTSTLARSSTRAVAPPSVATNVGAGVAAGVAAPVGEAAVAAAPTGRAELTSTRCKRIRISATEVEIEGRPAFPLPTARQGRVIQPLDRALERGCAVIPMTIGPDVPFAVAFPAINTVLARVREGVDVATTDSAPPLRVPAGLGDASIDVLTLELTDRQIRFRLLVGGDLPKRGTPLEKLTRAMSYQDSSGLRARVEALAAALPAQSIAYVGATASIDFSTVSAVLEVVHQRFPAARLSWME